MTEHFANGAAVLFSFGTLEDVPQPPYRSGSGDVLETLTRTDTSDSSGKGAFRVWLTKE